MDITGKGAVVTGAGSGIGRGIALALAKAGASGVIVADVQSERAESVAAEVRALGSKSAGFQCDVSRADSVEALADFAWETLGRVDILCNNAGVVTTGPGLRPLNRTCAGSSRSMCSACSSVARFSVSAS